jgi:signal transduction histidine kinase
MIRRAVGDRAPTLLSAVGVLLFTAAAVHHLWFEMQEIRSYRGPLLALLLDGVPAFSLLYGGYRLDRTGLDPDYRWLVVAGCLLGAGVAVSVMAGSIAVREFEGRTVAEPMFALLLAADSGAIAGAVAGYYNAATRADAERAERANDTLAFVNGLLRHDIRNGLTVIEGFATRIADEERGDSSATAILEETEEMLVVVQNAEAIVEALSANPDFDRVDLVPIVADVCERVEDVFAVTVSTDLPDAAPVAGNAALRSVVTNLVENAAEHNDRDDLRISVSVETDGNVVRLVVADNGSGILDDSKGAVFEPRAGSTHGGGLHMVDTLVDQFGGRLWVEDNDPQGTVFTAEFTSEAKRP